MLVWLSLLCSWVILRDENFHAMMKRYSERPFVILFVSPKCKDCDEIRENLRSVEESVKDHVYFAECACSTNPKMCSSFKKTDDSSIAFYDEACNHLEWMQKQPDQANIASFIETQLAVPFHFHSDKRAAEKQSGMGSNFLVVYQDREDPKMRMIKIAAADVRSNAKFYAVKGKSLKLIAYRGPYAYRVFKGEWTQEELDIFMDQNFFPFLFELNALTVAKLQEFEKMTVIAFINPLQSLEKLRKISETITSNFPMTYVKFSEKNALVRYIQVQENELPRIVLYDVRTKRWIPYDGEFSAPEIQNWIYSIDIDSATWSGSAPRRVLFSLSLMPRSTMFIIVSFLIVVFVVFLLCRVYRRRPTHRRNVPGFSQLKNV